MAGSADLISEMKKKKYRIVVERLREQPRKTEVFCASVKRALTTARALAKAQGPVITGSLIAEGFVTAWSAEGTQVARVHVDMLDAPEYVSIKHKFR